MLIYQRVYKNCVFPWLCESYQVVDFSIFSPAEPMRSKIALDLESDEYLDEAVSSGYGLAKPPLTINIWGDTSGYTLW